MPRAAGAKRRKPSELKVVLDSNAIYSLSASYLLNQEVYELIRESAQHSDLIISWYLPETVRHERQHQMRKQGLALFPPIQKLERLLGHNLNITEDIIEQRVQEAIDRQIAELNIIVLPVDSSKVDWDRIMLDAAYRRPPFSAGESEKGFRDALICQGFTQLVSISPTTPKVCRIALVTGDNLLTEAVKAQTTGRSNVRILPTIEELKGLINTLVSEVSEEFVENIKTKASHYFFQPSQTDSLYYKENVWQRITEKFPVQLSSRPEGAHQQEIEKVLVGFPRFVRKERQRIFWVSQITVRVKAYKYDYVDQWADLLGGGSPDIAGASSFKPTVPIDVARGAYIPNIGGRPLGDLWSGLRQSESESPVLTTGTVGNALMKSYGWGATPTKRLVKSGEIIFAITWSISVSTKKRSFSKPIIESVENTETAWA